MGGFTGNQGQKVGGFTGNQGQKVGGFTVDNWSESPLPVDKPRSGNRLGSPRNSFQQADGYKPSAARPGAAQWSIGPFLGYSTSESCCAGGGIVGIEGCRIRKPAGVV